MELNTTLQIVVLIALIFFIILSFFLMISLTSVTHMAKSASGALNKFSSEIASFTASLQDNISEMKLKFISSLKKADDTLGRIDNKLGESGGITGSISKILENTNKITDIAEEKSREITEFKNKAVESLTRADETLLSITESSKKLNTGLDSFVRLTQPINNIMIDLYNKVFIPYKQFSTFFRGFTRGYSMINDFIQKRFGKDPH